MTFAKRFRLYLIGFVPGCIILYFIIGQKSCTGPNALKMQELQFQKCVFTQKAQCQLKQLHIPDSLLIKSLKIFEVDYSKSSVHKKPFGVYYLKPKNLKVLFDLVIEDRDSLSIVTTIICNHKQQQLLHCNSITN